MERPPEFYDEIFAKGWPTRDYMPLYVWIADRVEEPVVDLGCGDGSLASVLSFRGVEYYTGFDFSEVAIETAESKDLGYFFVFTDVRDLGAIPEVGTVVMCELLEHLDDDLAVMEQVQPGNRVIGTVPSWMGASHVRCFEKKRDVTDRYGYLVEFEEIERIDNPKLRRRGRYWWCFNGTRI